MISASDNMATDLLIERLGPGAVERALVDRRAPRPGQHDAVPDHARAVLGRLGQAESARAVEDRRLRRAARSCSQQTNSRPYEPDPKRTHTPASDIGAEWYGSAADICRRARRASGAPRSARRRRSRRSCPAIPGIELDRAKWPYIGAKAGNLPGDLTFSWYAVDRTGQPWVVSFQLNWPQFRSQTAAAGCCRS